MDFYKKVTKEINQWYGILNEMFVLTYYFVLIDNTNVLIEKLILKGLCAI